MNVGKHGVDLASDGIREISNGRTSLFVPRAAVREIHFAHGFIMERVAVMVGVGGAMAAFAVYGALQMAYAPVARFPVAIICGVGAVGFVMLYEGLRRGPYLRVVLANDVRKIRLDKGTTAEDADRLLAEAARTCGYADVLRGVTAPYR